MTRTLPPTERRVAVQCLAHAHPMRRATVSDNVEQPTDSHFATGSWRDTFGLSADAHARATMARGMPRNGHGGSGVSGQERDIGSAILFGPFRLVPAERRLERDGTPVTLGSRALDILIALAERPGEVLSKETLLSRAWPDLTVDESNLRFHISGLRKALDNGVHEQDYIVNVPGRGYCLAAVTRAASVPRPVSRSSIATSPQWPSLPLTLDRMVGRADVVERVADALATHRFVTILGVGGMGKTTVAIAAMHMLLKASADNVRFLDLGAITDPSLVATTLASSIGIAARSGDATPEIIDYLRDCDMLIVLDGCEHVVDSVAVLAETIYLDAPRTRLLATSRERLKVEGEHVLILSELARPPQRDGLAAAEVLSFPAARLLADRAAAAGYSAPITDEDAAIIADICRTLDGVPLAIELVAGRVADYGWRQTAALLEGQFRLLWSGRRTAPARHQSLSAALDWSHHLLDETQRKVFLHLSIFAGAFGLQDAWEVAGGADLTKGEVVAAVQALVDKSLVCVSQGTLDRGFRLLDTTRAYAREKLAASGVTRGISRRHAVCVLHALEAAGQGSEEPNLGDVYAALGWSFTDPDGGDVAIELAAAASRLFIARSLLNECRRWSERALALAEHRESDARMAMTLNGALGQALMFTDCNGDEARIALERALELAYNLQDFPAQFRLLTHLHMYHRRCGDIARLLPISRRLETLAVQIGEPVAISSALTQLAVAFHLSGDQPSARSHLDAVRRMDVFGDTPPDHFAFHRHPSIALSRCLWLSGYPDQAVKLAQPLADETCAPDAVTYGIGLIWSASVFEWTGDWATVGRLAERLVAHARSHSLRPYQAVGLGLQGKVLLKAGQLGPGVALLRSAIASLRVTRYELYTANFEASLATGLLALQHREAAWDVIEAAVERTKAEGQTCDLPELLRIKGEAQADRGSRAAALNSFSESMDMAECQGALSWVLRSAMSRFIHAPEEESEKHARQLLEATYSRFSEGFGTADLIAAGNLLGRPSLRA